MIPVVLFWCSLAGIATTYFVTPLVLLALTLVHKRRRVDDREPSVSLVISAYNEESVIAQKLENSLALDYPRGLLEIMVISDGSDDATDEIARSFSDRNVKLCRQEPRGGKSAGLTRFIPEAQGEILVFSDANSMYAADAVRKLVRHFGDSEVGFVAGHQRYHADEGIAATSESLYWRYETAVKALESRVGSVVCGDGAIYAVRAELFEPLAPDDINDFTLPLKIIIRGYRGVFDLEAVCYEHAAADCAGEFRRRVRIVNRSFRAVCRNWRALSPVHVGWFAVQLFVHKVLRWFVPLLLAVAFVTNAYLAVAQGGLFYQSFLGVQLFCYLLAYCYVIPPLRKWKPVYVCFYFCLANAAAALGIVTCLTGRRYQTWTPERARTQSLDRAPVAESAGLATATSLRESS